MPRKSTTPAAEPLKPAPSTVTVKVLCAALAEDGHHSQGETFTTTAERAAALGPLVQIVMPD